jgi:di/tricarboxylate transporter
MSWEIIFIFILLGLGVISFVQEKMPSDLTAIVLFSVILLVSAVTRAFSIECSLPKVEDLLRVLANPAPLTVGAMFIISAALEKCGVINWLAGGLSQLAKLHYRQVLFVMIFPVAFISAFINNTPVVIIFMPVILSLSRQMDVPASKLLIPLSYASIFGGCCTLVGSSTNILASGIIQEFGNQPPIGMFELSVIGLPLLVVGTLYLVFIGHKILPERATLTSILSDDERKEYITEAFVQSSSSVVGKSVEESGILKKHSVRVLEIIRNSVALPGDIRKIKLCERDRLVLSCRPSGIAHTRSVHGLNLIAEMGLGLETIAAHEGSIVEGIIGPTSSIVGKNISEINFRQRFRMIVLAIHRRGINVRDKIYTLSLQFGDTLLMMGTDSAVEELRRSDDILLLDRPATATKTLQHKSSFVLSILMGVVLVAALTPIPIVVTAVTGCMILFLTGCIKPKEGYDSIQWNILILIYCMLGVGVAMQESGAANLLADGIINLVESIFSEHWRLYALLAVLYLCTSVLTEFLSNNATVVLMLPIALSVAQGMDPRPFIITVCIASSASFSTPIGYQTNTYVYGAGGYKFTDFYKVGLPLEVLYFFVIVFLVPVFWPF